MASQERMYTIKKNWENKLKQKLLALGSQDNVIEMDPVVFIYKYGKYFILKYMKKQKLKLNKKKKTIKRCDGRNNTQKLWCFFPFWYPQKYEWIFGFLKKPILKSFKSSCYGIRHFRMLFSMCIYCLFLFVFCQWNQGLYDVFLHERLNRHYGISVKVFRALLNSLQSAANLLHERQPVITCVSKFAVTLVKV